MTNMNQYCHMYETLNMSLVIEPKTINQSMYSLT